ncbi:hypothetical protein [Paraconexibacter algicola]|uniref:Uncharacterized protein n=1 Tax=Paraconexibacter algicola TaxID=2133960 RepID=A0A2T4UE00_9ACTN|nr:hypothetical protein [Paraconexibacter algicola]PTL55740.1 hypothetical protein C7Y72_19110 [Paraconexibacter algicola]
MIDEIRDHIRDHPQAHVLIASRSLTPDDLAPHPPGARVRHDRIDLADGGTVRFVRSPAGGRGRAVDAAYVDSDTPTSVIAAIAPCIAAVSRGA